MNDEDWNIIIKKPGDNDDFISTRKPDYSLYPTDGKNNYFIKQYEYKNLDLTKIEDIILGRGALVDICYQVQKIKLRATKEEAV